MVCRVAEMGMSEWGSGLDVEVILRVRRRGRVVGWLSFWRVEDISFQMKDQIWWTVESVIFGGSVGGVVGGCDEGSRH